MSAPSSASIASASVVPTTAVAGEFSTWVVRLVVGRNGLVKGDRLSVQLPDSWHFGEQNTAKPVQSSRPDLPNYVSGRTSSSGAEVAVSVEGGVTQPTKVNREGLDGRRGRYVFVATTTVIYGELIDGDIVDVVFGERSGGSVGFEAARWADGPEVVSVEIQKGGHAPERILESALPTIEVRNGPPAEMTVIAPSRLALGDSGLLRIALLDEHGNRCEDYVGNIRLLASESCLAIQDSVAIGPTGKGIVSVPIEARGIGIERVEAVSDSGLSSRSNPTKVTEHVDTSLYWGDLHAHGVDSFDAIGRHAFRYARDVSGLDFFALTDHCEMWPDEAWVRLRDAVKNEDRPGEFATILGYEATFPGPWGHHNVYFRGLEGPVLGSDEGSLLDLWDALESHKALTIPHHTGVRFAGAEGVVTGGGTPNPDWQFHKPRLRRLIEIYSGHGQSEAFDPAHPLSYENTRFDHLATSSDGPHYAQDAWRLGYELGVIGSSDDHHGQPGRGELGLAAVWANHLAREEIFDGLARRSTYATTGARIILEFSVNNCAMGGTVVSDSGICHIHIEAHGTDIIDTVELLAHDIEDEAIEVRARWTPHALDFTVDHTDDTVREGFYYVRVRQANRYRERTPMAWSSPVWVTSTVASLREKSK